jgi:ubiquinone/menaquinone biosynthesis C-methylase UbiE
MADTRSPEDLVYELINGFRSSQLVALAADLNLADLLTEEPKTAATLARATGSHEPSLRRVLGGLCALGVFREDDDGRFHETPLSACLRSGRRAHAQARFSPREGAAAFAELAYTVRTGKPAYELVYGKARFEHLSQDADASARFNAGMAVQAEIDARAICEAIDLSSASTVVDVGGGRAALIATVLAANPRMHGVVVDLAAGLMGAKEQLEANGVADRCRLVEGSFFETVPAGGDIYVLRWILHDWDDRRAGEIVAVVARAMAPGTRLLIIERLRPPRYKANPADLRIAMADLQMLVVLGGRERTEQEFSSLLAPAGLTLKRKTPLPSGTWVLEAQRAGSPGVTNRDS